MPPKRPVRVYPVEGRYITGVPHVPHDCEDDFCVESGAFTKEPPPAAKPEPEPPADESKED